MSDEKRTGRDELAAEFENFREIAAQLKPTPKEEPTLEGVDIAHLLMPLHGTVGGDHIVYIDFKRRYRIDRRIAEAERMGRSDVARTLAELPNRAGILVADVSGHRSTDAMVAAMLHQAFLLGAYYELQDFGEITTRIFEQINTRFYRTTAVNKYFTMIYGEITASGRFRFISAGHQPPRVFSREYGRFMKISGDRLVSFPPVGLLPSSDDVDKGAEPAIIGYKQRYEVNEINLLAAGDVLLLFTDGLAEHGGGDFFPESVERLMAECGGCSAREIRDLIEQAILDAAEPEDDITVVVIKRSI